jgi:hypothetical protein
VAERLAAARRRPRAQAQQHQRVEGGEHHDHGDHLRQRRGLAEELAHHDRREDEAGERHVPRDRKLLQLRQRQCHGLP